MVINLEFDHSKKVINTRRFVDILTATQCQLLAWWPFFHQSEQLTIVDQGIHRYMHIHTSLAPNSFVVSDENLKEKTKY